MATSTTTALVVDVGIALILGAGAAAHGLTGAVARRGPLTRRDLRRPLGASTIALLCAVAAMMTGLLDPRTPVPAAGAVYAVYRLATVGWTPTPARPGLLLTVSAGILWAVPLSALGANRGTLFLAAAGLAVASVETWRAFLSPESRRQRFAEQPAIESGSRRRVADGILHAAVWGALAVATVFTVSTPGWPAFATDAVFVLALLLAAAVVVSLVTEPGGAEYTVDHRQQLADEAVGVDANTGVRRAAARQGTASSASSVADATPRLLRGPMSERPPRQNHRGRVPVVRKRQ